MSENYIVINGKRTELTEKQLKELGIEVETKRKNPFERVEAKKTYYSACNAEYEEDIDLYSYVDDSYYECANYFNDKEFAQQVALHQLLYRKLLKFAYDNESEASEMWDSHIEHWYIYYDSINKNFCTEHLYVAKHLDAYFSTREGAERAIEEVVEPFMKEHPDFVW